MTVPPTFNFVVIGESMTLHVVREPKPLRGTPEHVKAWCGRKGAPKLLVLKTDSRAIRVGRYLVCENCRDLTGASRV